ncbi:Serum paraoxonase/arylesterase 2-like protein [Cladobotryum mycophilum]|uniref:Serum paraoxonase/arylesterase 2-like protein n=1 Tax=Cladobotryum mycophilum TaxID=491253 RepID=A0ABR0S7X1_9HYPO
MARTSSLITLSIIPFLFFFLYDRSQMLSLFYSNAPHRLQHINKLGNYEIKFTDTIRNCEDAWLVEQAGAAILSCDPGREKWNTNLNYSGPIEKGGLWLYNYAPTEGKPESLVRIEFVGYEESEFHPLGVTYHESSSTLFAINHLKDGLRIDIFNFQLSKNSASAPRAVHQRYIKHPLLHSPNSLVLINENELYVTNDHHFLHPKHSFLRALEDYGAVPGGTVVHIDLRTDAVRTVARVPFANGVELLNVTTVAVASTTKPAVYLFEMSPSTRDLTYRAMIRVPFLVDNLSVDENGVLLMAGHPHVVSLQKWAKTRHICRSEGAIRSYARRNPQARGYPSGQKKVAERTYMSAQNFPPAAQQLGT